MGCGFSNLEIIMKFFSPLLALICFVIPSFGATPAFSDFDTTQFVTTGNKVKIKNGVITTNLVDNGNVIIGGNLSVTGAITSVNGTLVSNMTDNWTNSATQYSAIKMYATNTASLAGSMLLDLGTNAKPIFRVRKESAAQLFNTWTDETTFERGGMFWSNNVFYIMTENGPSGGTARDLYIRTPSRQWTFSDASGAANFPANLSLAAGANYSFVGRTLISATMGDGLLTLFNQAASGFTRLTLGGINTNFPAIGRNGGELYFQLADGSRGAVVSPGGLKRVSTQVDSVNNTLGTVTGLLQWVEAGKTYHFVAHLDATLDATGGAKYAINGGATATAISYRVRHLGASLAVVSSTRQTSLGSAVNSTAALTDDDVMIEGVITVNAAGTLLVQFAQQSANGTSSILVGSTFEVTAIQ